MDRAELASLVESVGCRVTRRAGDGMPLEYDCGDDPWRKVRMLDRLAEWDARYDPRVRGIALSIVRAYCPGDTRPHVIAKSIHRAVRVRVRYVSEGIETFQPSAFTWSVGLGDCDDSARLVVALARALGQPANVRALSNRDGVPVHAVGEIGGQWAEASIPARFGEHPLAAWRRCRTYNYRPTMGDVGDVSSDAAARQALSDAWDQVDGLPAKTDAALQMVQAIAAGPERSYGEGCWSRCPGVCHNWGSLQLPGSPTTHDGSVPDCPAGSAPCTDTIPRSDGTSTPYGVCFLTFEDQASGARKYLEKLLLTYGGAGQVASGSATAMASAMYANHYFGGFGATADERIANYARGISDAAAGLSSRLGEPLYVTLDGSGAAGQSSALSAIVGGAALAGVAWYGYRRGWHRAIAREANALAGRARRALR